MNADKKRFAVKAKKVGVFRDRTEFFKHHRDETVGARKNASGQFRTTLGGSVVDAVSGGSHSSGYSVVGKEDKSAFLSKDGADELRVDIPPVWMSLVDEVNYDIERIKSKIKELKTLHQKHLLPGFDDRVEEEQAIEIQTGEITELFHKAQARVKALGKRPSNSDEEERMKKNVQMNLASSLQSLSSRFRSSQKSYLQNLQARNDQSNRFSYSEVMLEEGNGGSAPGQLSMDMYDTGFDEKQLRELEKIEGEVDSRTHEIMNIQRSIIDLAEIFRELAILIVDQGTILDRIDYNIENTAVNIDHVVKELDEVRLSPISPSSCVNPTLS
ncbi:Syntaxin-16, variant 2 [Balamuthia mandrillaris]